MQLICFLYFLLRSNDSMYKLNYKRTINVLQQCNIFKSSEVKQVLYFFFSRTCGTKTLLNISHVFIYIYFQFYAQIPQYVVVFTESVKLNQLYCTSGYVILQSNMLFFIQNDQQWSIKSMIFLIHEKKYISETLFTT